MFVIIFKKLRVISEVIFCAESITEIRIVLPCLNFEIFDVIYAKMAIMPIFEVKHRQKPLSSSSPPHQNENYDVCLKKYEHFKTTRTLYVFHSEKFSKIN